VIKLLESAKAACQQMKATRRDFISAIGYDPHEDDCSIWQEELEDLDKAISDLEGEIAATVKEASSCS
jgi:hypothetical protein